MPPQHHRSYSICFASLLGAAFLATTVQAQLTIGIPGLFEVNLTVPDEVEEFFSGGDDDAISSGGNISNPFDGFDFEALFEDLSNMIGESFDNFTLPTELEDIIDLPTFDNFTFSFGGNCSICDHMEEFDGGQFYNEIPCSDWANVATLGIPDGSEQCDILRVAAVQSCGCPVPEEYATQTCSLCPEGEAPSSQQTSSENVLLVMCTDLEQAPAVDGDRTCDLIAQLAPQCDCQPTSSATASENADETGDSTETTEAESNESPVSAAFQMQLTLVATAVGGIVSAFI